MSMEQNNPIPVDQDENREMIWREIASMIQASAQSVQALTFGEFKLAFQILKEQIKHATDAKNINSPQNIASLQRQHALLSDKKAKYAKEYQNNLKTIHQMEETNQEHPRALLILEISEEKLGELYNYAENSRYNLKVLQDEINLIPTQGKTDESPTPSQ